MDSEKKSIQYKNSKFRKEDLPSYEILFEYGFGNLACFLSKENELLFFDSFQWNYSEPEKEVSKLEAVFKTFDFFEIESNNLSIKLSYKSNVFTLIPSELFQSENNADYLDFVSSEKYPMLSHCELKSMKAHIVFPIETAIIHFFNSRFSQVQVVNSTSIWMDELINLGKIGQESLSIRINDAFIEVVYIYNKNLKLANIFKFENAEELLFYLLSITQHYRMNREKIDFYVSGFILGESKLFELLKKYFLKVEMVDFSKSIEVNSGIQTSYFPHFSKFI